MDKKSLKTTKNSNKKSFILPPVKDKRHRSPAPSITEKMNNEDNGEQTLSEIYALTQQMGVVGGSLKNRHKSIDINSTSYKRDDTKDPVQGKYM